MDVTSLLNVPSISNHYQDKADSSCLLRKGKDSAEVLAGLPTPSPERTSSRRGSDTDSNTGRKPWNADGYKIPILTATVPYTDNIFAKSPSRQLSSPVSHGRSSTGSHSRRTSMDSSSADGLESQGVGLSMSTHLVRSPTLDYDNRPDVSPENSFASGTQPKPEPARLPGWDEHYAVTAGISGASRHRFSDSRSSLSSFGSSHSRFSSVTTVSMASSIASTLTEMPLLEDELAKSLEPRLMPTVEGVTQLSTVPSLQSINAAMSTSREFGRAAEKTRASSPSDTILIRESTIRSRNDGDIGSSAIFRDGYLAAPPKLHKRAISAPAFASISASFPPSNHSRTHPVLPPPHQTMAPPIITSPRGHMTARDSVLNASCPVVPEESGSCQLPEDVARDDAASFAAETASHSDRRNATKNSVHTLDTVKEGSVVRSPNIAIASPDDRESTPEPVLRCMFVENCNTGSNQLRKAISHFFGRNKSCTKLIPKEVWVYFCRKHYQRCRYRNAKTYPDNQIGYVITQIERIKDWDMGNQQKGSSTRIKSWQFALRKREKNRLQNEAADPEDDEFEQLASSDITPPPQWVLDAVDSDIYTTDDILGFAQRFQQEIRDGNLGGIPEVEFLPMIEGGKQNESGKSAGKKTRKQSRSNSDAKATKRKANDSPEPLNPLPAVISNRFASRARAGGFELVSPSEKRARLDGPPGLQQHQPSHLPAPHSGLPTATRFSPVHQSHSFASYEHSVPTRAPNVVPMFRHGLGHQPSPYGHGYHNSSPPQFSLPSISSQLQGTLESRPSFFAHGGHEQPGVRPNNPYRASHQRSASAFTPVNRPTAPFARPSSSGHDAPAAQPRFHDENHSVLSYALDARNVYNDRHLTPQYAYDHGMPRQYGQENAPQQHLAYASAPPQPFEPRQPQAYGGPSYTPPRAPVATMADREEERNESEARQREDDSEARYGIPRA